MHQTFLRKMSSFFAGVKIIVYLHSQIFFEICSHSVAKALEYRGV
jgi:hypothetical protein